MKIYFESGNLRTFHRIPERVDEEIVSSNGLFQNILALNRLLDKKPGAVVYTNTVLAFDNKFVWNEELGVPELYVRPDPDADFVRVDELSSSVLTKDSTLLELYPLAEMIPNSDPAPASKSSSQKEDSTQLNKSIFEKAKVIVENRESGIQPAIFIIEDGRVYMITITPDHQFYMTDEGAVGENYDEDGKWCGN